MATWREKLDRLSEAIERARANAQPLLPQRAEAVYRLLDEYRLAGAPGLDSELPAPIVRRTFDAQPHNPFGPT
ncbi:MAG: hypothetical protein ABW110_21265 [Steroidobacteraceae bacterium]